MHALLLAPRQAGIRALAQPRAVTPFEHQGGDRAVFAVRGRVGHSAHQHHIGDAEREIQGGLLRQHRALAREVVAPPFADRPARKFDAATGRGEFAVQASQQRGFAGAIRAHHDNQFAGGEFRREIIQQHVRTNRDTNAACFQHQINARAR